MMSGFYIMVPPRNADRELSSLAGGYAVCFVSMVGVGPLGN